MFVYIPQIGIYYYNRHYAHLAMQDPYLSIMHIILYAGIIISQYISTCKPVKLIMVIYSTFTNFVIKTVMHKFYIDFIIYIRSVSLVKTYIYNNMPKDQNLSNKYTFKNIVQ